MAGSANELGRDRGVLAAALRWLLWSAVVGAALTAVVVSHLVANAGHVRPTPTAVTLAILACAASQAARIPARVGADVVMVGWSEVGLIAAVCLVPTVWVPAVCLSGALIAHGHHFVGADRAWRMRVAFAIANATVAGTAAAWVVAAADPAVAMVPPTADPVLVDLAHPLTLLPLLLGALVAFLVPALLAATWVSGEPDARPGPASWSRGRPARAVVIATTWLRFAKAKQRVFAGNMVAALAVAAAAAINPWWLVALVPVLFALHQAYAFRLRSGTDWSNWAALAEATVDLNQLDQQGVARAALRGAVELFSPGDVELVLDQPGGRLRYVSAGADEPRGGAVEPRSLNALTSPQPGRRLRGTPGWAALGLRRETGPTVAVRQLDVGGHHLGEIRLTLRRRRTFGAAEQHAFATFADAVASALHDATTSRDLQAMTARSAFEAIHDPLTGLTSRSTLIAQGNAHLRRADPGPAVALILIDLDGFRAVNDALGLAAGDELLRVLSRRLSQRCGPDELVGRAGADEFAVLLTNPTARRAAVHPRRGDPSDALHRGWAHPMDRARDLLAALAVPVEVAGGTIAVEASAGVVIEAGAGDDMSELLRRAESALRQAKREQARVARYDPAYDLAATSRLALLAEFRDALTEADQIFVELQPTVDLRTGVAVGAEALVRWRHPRLGVLGPRDFMPVIEGTELGASLTGRVLQLAVAVAADWAARGVDLPISVNLCHRCILDGALPGRLAEMLAAHRVDASRLILEITESVTADADAARPVMAQLRAAGVRISVDDFGSGSASLSFLTNFVVDEVKVERAFVSAMVTSPEAAAIVRAAVDLARRLGLRVVAEGVETAQQRDALVGFGVTTGQGYLFHPPLPVAEATALLSS